MNPISLLCQENGNYIRCERTIWVRIETFERCELVNNNSNIKVVEIPWEYYYYDSDENESKVRPKVYYSDIPFLLKTDEADYYAIPVPQSIVTLLINCNSKTTFEDGVNLFAQYIDKNAQYIVDKIIREIVEKHYDKIIYKAIRHTIEVDKSNKLYYIIARYLVAWSIILQLSDIYIILGLEKDIIIHLNAAKAYSDYASECGKAIIDYLKSINKI